MKVTKEGLNQYRSDIPPIPKEYTKLTREMKTAKGIDPASIKGLKHL